MDFWTTVIAQADQDIADSTVLADDAELAFPVEAGKIYEFELFLVQSSPDGAAVPDIRHGYAGPAGMTGQKFATVHALSPNNNPGNFSVEALTVVNGGGTATTPRCVRQVGWVYTPEAGTFRVQWAQGTSSANPTRRHAGSVLRYRDLTQLV